MKKFLYTRIVQNWQSSLVAVILLLVAYWIHTSRVQLEPISAADIAPVLGALVALFSKDFWKKGKTQ